MLNGNGEAAAAMSPYLHIERGAPYHPKLEYPVPCHLLLLLKGKEN